MFYVSDNYNNKIRRINSTGFTTTFAGNGSLGNIDGPGLSSTFNNPTSIVLDSLTRNLTVISANSLVPITSSNNFQTNYSLRRITPDGTISLFAGTGNSKLSGIVVDNSSNYYVFNQDTYCGA